jgi:NADH-quinone oxidoreductase subunit N
MQLSDISALVPEIILACVGMTILLLELVIKRKSVIAAFTLAGALAAILALKTVPGAPFDGMFIGDPYSVFFKFVFLINLIFSVLISSKYLESEGALRGEYYALLALATTGMMVMASAGDLILLYLGLELMALSTYILAGFVRHDFKGNEAAIKYFLMGAFSSAVLLYATSFVYGLTGTTNLRAIAEYISANDVAKNPMLMVSIAMFIVSFGFKIAAAPFHMWAPDVYEGAPTPVTAFMSVGPKAAGFAVFARVFMTAFPLQQIHWAYVLIPVAVLTMAVGSILAIQQTNIKRMLAYSSIAHAGYAMLGIVAGTQEGVSAMMNYMLIYVFMNVGAFSIVIMLRSAENGFQDISDYQGLAKRRPMVAALMLIFMFSLTGIPPTAGFIGKFFIFKSLIQVGYIWPFSI